MKAIYAPLTFSWRGSHSGGWLIGVVVVAPRKPLIVEWRVPQRVEGAASGGFDLKDTLEAYEQRICQSKDTSGGVEERLSQLKAGWAFGTVQIGAGEEISGEFEQLIDLSCSHCGL